MSEETNTTANTTIVTLSAKVYESDRTAILEYAKGFQNVRDGFSDIVKRIQGTPAIKDINSIEPDFREIFELSSYESFVDATDTSCIDAVKRGLEVANKLPQSIKEAVDNANQNLPGHRLEFDEETNKKLTALRRFLKSKDQIPKDATEKEFLEQLFISLFEKHIDNKYEFLNKD